MTWSEKIKPELWLLEGLQSPESNHLCTFVLDLAITTTKWIVQKRCFHFESLGLSIRDVATDAIAELLSGSGDEMPIIRYLKQNVRDIDEPILVEAHLRAIIVRTINQNITRILAEYDPVYAKSLRMLRIHVRKCGGVAVKQAISGCWYHRASEADTLFHLPALHADALKTRITIKHGDGNPSVVVLDACLEYLGSQNEFRKAVHESDVMRLTLDLLGSDLHSAKKESEDARDNHDYKLLVDAVETAVAETRHWAAQKYVKKQKLSVPELESMIGAIRMFVIDCSDGEPESHFFYLHKHLPGLTYERFRADYRNTFQYILKQFFTIAKGLLVSLGYEQMDSTADMTGN